jgi:hypothetical protein
MKQVLGVLFLWFVCVHSETLVNFFHISGNLSHICQPLYPFLNLDVHFDPLAQPELYNATTHCRPPSYQPNDPLNWELFQGGVFGRYGCDSPLSLLQST